MKNTEGFKHCEFRKHRFPIELALVLGLLPKSIIVKVYETGKTSLDWSCKVGCMKWSVTVMHILFYVLFPFLLYLPFFKLTYAETSLDFSDLPHVD